VLIGCAVLLVVTMTLGVAIGSVALSPGAVWQAVFDRLLGHPQPDTVACEIVWLIRLPGCSWPRLSAPRSPPPGRWYRPWCAMRWRIRSCSACPRGPASGPPPCCVNAEAIVAIARWLHPAAFGLPADGS
jgi:hypothetical protein